MVVNITKCIISLVFRAKPYVFFKSFHPTHTLAGFDLMTSSLLGGVRRRMPRDQCMPYRQGDSCMVSCYGSCHFKLSVNIAEINFNFELIMTTEPNYPSKL
jgi:hypothetical protein